MSKIIFSGFTNLYKLSKTLRFELKPVRETESLLVQNQVFKKDKAIDDSYHKIKIYFDILHRKFVKESLLPKSLKGLDLRQFEKSFFVASKRKKTSRKAGENNLRKAEKNLYKDIANIFNETGDKWKKKYQGKEYKNKNGQIKKIKFRSSGCKILTDEAVLHILEDHFKDKKKFFRNFYGFFTYFAKFNATRSNFYKSDGTSTAIPTRIVENLEIFLQNKLIFENKYRPIIKKLGLSQSEKEIFNLAFYKRCFLQAGIDRYNRIIGGKDETDKNINQKINEYRQKSKNKLPFLRKLHKQILSEKDKKDELHIENDQGFRRLLEKFAKNNCQKERQIKKLLCDFFQDSPEDFELGKIYLSSVALNTLSGKYFSDWNVIRMILLKNIDKNKVKKLPDFISWASLKDALDNQDVILPEDLFKKEFYEKDYFDKKKTPFDNFRQIYWEEFAEREKEAGRFLHDLKKDDFWATGKISNYRKNKGDKGFRQIEKIKKYCDATLNVYRMAKYFSLEKNKQTVMPENGADANFYNAFQDYYEDYDFIRYYNAFRNYLTRKPYNENKIKLNFDKGNLLGGWAESPKGNAQYAAYIFRRNGKYFLGVTTYPRLMDDKKYPEIGDAGCKTYERMIYKQLKSTTIYGSSYWSAYNSKYKDDKEKYPSGDLIERVKAVIRKKHLNDFPVLKTILKKNYTHVDELAKDLGDLPLYSLSFKPINSEYIKKSVYKINRKDKYLYLFAITNKDFQKKNKKTKDNLHTTYFKMLFNEKNLKSPIFKLSGGAEVFMRQATAKDKLEKKKDKRGKVVLIHKRYSKDKYLFHLPIVLNMNKKEITSREFNRKINDFLGKNRAKINIIGVDRGEKHLAYYSLINAKGKILKQGTLNTAPGGNGKLIDYHKLLDKREKERLESRRSWQAVNKIKDLKKGYISQVVKKLADLAVNNNAIIVFEDLNSGFKRGRQKIEKQIYQNLEKGLIEKLNYLVFKNSSLREAGGALNAYQLTAPFTAFKKMGKQTGIIFYANPAYTSTTDPITGWRKNIYISNSASVKKIKSELGKLKKMGWDKKKKSYFFEYDQKDFGHKVSKIWRLYADGDRIWRKKNKAHWEARLINPNNMLAGLFEAFGFGKKNGDILRQIQIMDKKLLKKRKVVIPYRDMSGKKKTEKSEWNFYKFLIFTINLILQIRNSFSARWEEGKDGKIQKPGKDYDFIQSPVDPFFSSRKAKKDQPDNGDANGAYNIARKGMMILKMIADFQEKNGNCKNLNWGDLIISNNDWDKFVQQS